MREPRVLTMKLDEEPEGWCSLCQGPAERGVYIRQAQSTGGQLQTDVKFEPVDEDAPWYRFGACCIGRMIVVLETKGDSK